jgi:hypothetical protein
LFWLAKFLAHCEEKAGAATVGLVQGAFTSARGGADAVAASACIRGKRTRSVGTGRKHVEFFRVGFSNVAADPSTEISASQGASGFGFVSDFTGKFDQAFSVIWSASSTPGRTVLVAAAELGIGTSDGEEEGGENDVDLDHLSNGTRESI